MRDPQVLFHEPVLRGHNVIVGVVGKSCAQAVGRFGRFTGSERIGQDDVVMGGVERLPRPEKLPRETLGQEPRGGASRPVQDQHRLARWRSNRRVMQLQFGGFRPNEIGSRARPSRFRPAPGNSPRASQKARDRVPGIARQGAVAWSYSTFSVFV